MPSKVGGRLVLLIPYEIATHWKRSISAAIRDFRKKEEVFLDNLNLARKIAHEYSHKCPEPYEVLENLAFTGLWKAVDRLEEDRARLSTFSQRYIQGEIQRYLRDHGYKLVRVPRAWQEWYELVQREYRRQEDAYNQGLRLIPAPSVVELDEMLKSANETQGLLGTTRPPKVDDVKYGRIYLTWPELVAAMSRQVFSFDAMEVERNYDDDDGEL